MIPVRGYSGRKVAVLGLGRSGLAAARALESGAAQAICWDDGETARQAAADLDFEVRDLTRPGAFDGVDALIVSPGIPHLYPEPHKAVAAAWEAGVVVDNDVGLFFRSVATEDWADYETPPKIICVTGSNGKSTTTALIGRLMEQAGKPVQLGGNIGRGVLDLDPPGEGGVIVLELSSYQIDLARALSPDVAVFLNLSPDHLDRHGGMGGYYAAKQRLFTLGGPERAIIGVDEMEGRHLAALLREDAYMGEPVIRISANRKLQGDGWSVFARRGFLSEWRKGRQVASFDLRDMATLPGAHNHQNACAAYAAARTFGVSPRVIEQGMKTFSGLPHRMELVAEIGGVRFVNDSKATNADAAEKALKAADKVRWIAGGVPKAGGIAPLASLFDRVAKTYLIGEAAKAFAETLGGRPHQIAGDLDTAVRLAAAEAAAGDTVLLSPACASFDQYDSFEARGDAFKAAVAALNGGGS